MRPYLFTAALLITSCATVPATEVPLSTTFTKSDVAWFAGTGIGKIEGSAFLRTKGGAVKTCAGYDVQLLPYSAYAAERMRFIYGNETKGHLFGPRRAWKFVPDEPDFYSSLKKSVCNANGEFEFEGLPAGDYYIITNVTWDICKVFDEGGKLMQKVSIADGEVKKATLTAY